MHRLRAIVVCILAVAAICSPSFASGLGLCMSGTGSFVSETASGEPVNLPSPCDLQGGKRVMPAQSDVAARRAVEVPRATVAQWQFGLSDEAMRDGRYPAMELEPPRAA